mmetsp:Transcript_76368/g.223977  ORF Transcript_76368/g.223977 Transcript_76368/m.223977 type:complete len:317 (+) Transcript_76368:48-998(+)
MIDVVVRNVAGDSIDLEVQQDDTVCGLKDKIVKHWPVPQKYQQVVHESAVLADAERPAARSAPGGPALQLTMVVCLDAMRQELAAGSFNRQVNMLKNLLPLCRGSGDVVVVFVCSLLEEPGVRAAASRALGVLAKGDERARDFAAKRLGHEEPEVREAAVEALAEVACKGDRSVMALLGGCSEDESPRVRRAMLEAFAKVAERGDAEALAVVGACLGDTAYDVRWAAVRALQHLTGQGDAEAVARLGAFLGDASYLVRLATAEALAALAARGDDGVLAVLAKHLEVEDDHAVKGAVEAALAQLGGEEALRRAALAA